MSMICMITFQSVYVLISIHRFFFPLSCHRRAGMIAIPDPDHTLDMKKLFNGVMDKLPGYARPFFVRICQKELDLTGNVVRKYNSILFSFNG